MVTSRVPARRAALWLGALVVLVAPAAPRAETQVSRTLHPIFSAVPGVPNADQAHKRFAAAAARFRMGPVEVIDVPAPPAPRAAEMLKSVKLPLERLEFAKVEATLDAAVAEARETGGDGLTPAELADLFLHHAMAAQRADWKELSAPPTEITPPKARASYLQAATLDPSRVLAKHLFPPIAIASFQLAANEIKARPRGAIVVRAATSALISVDGREPKPGLVTASDLPYGDHFVRVEEGGRKPWVSIVPLSEPALTVDPPQTHALTLDDARAAAAARRMEGAFALVAEMTPGPDARIDLRLVDATTGARKDSVSVPFVGDPARLDAAITRLETEARKAVFGERKTTLLVPSGGGALPTEVGVANIAATPAPTDRPRVSFKDDPAAWARDHWPLVTAIGVSVGGAIALAFAAR